MVLNITNIKDFSDETLHDIIATCKYEINARKDAVKKEKIKQILGLLRELNELNPTETGWYDMGDDREYTWYEFMVEFADYHNISLD